MKKHRFLALFLALTLTALTALTACGAQDGGQSSSGSGASSPDVSTSGDSSTQTELEMNKQDISLYQVGETFQLSVTGVPEGTTVEWRTSEEQIATVDQNGLVTAVAPGIASVFAYCGEDYVKCTIRCKFESYADESGATSGDQSQAENPLTLSSSDFSLFHAGDTHRLTVSGQPEGTTLLWASSDESVATVADDGTVTAVAAGTATISVSVATDPGMTATCIVRCKLSQDGDSSSQTPDGSGDSSTQEPPAQSGVDLSAFAEEVLSSYYGESSFLQLANNEMLDGYYAGLTGVDTDQCLVYITMMSMNNGEFGLVQVKNSADVDTVKAIFQARIDYMVGDGNGPGGAWYPGPTEQWTNNSRVVSNGNYVMMVVNENCDAIVDAFNALF